MPSSEELIDETAWLIEFSHLGTPHYYGSDDEEGLGQTSDHLRAVRFARAEDAQAIIDDIGWTEAKPVEHMWCAAHPAPTAADTLAWVVSRWNAEVKNRPLVNVHRRSLDDTWRQVIRHLGGDPVALCGPSHDELLEQEDRP